MNLGSLLVAAVLFRELIKPVVPTEEELKSFLGGWGL